MIKIMSFQNGLPRGFGLTSAAVGALMVAALSFPLPVRADGLPNPLANFMGGGTDNGPIDYRPRPALVVPPTNDLPPPQTSSTVPSANWPKAPDTTILNAAKADSRRPAPSEDSQLPDDVANQKVVLQDENECNKVLGMPMCFSGWGQEGGRPKPVVLTTPQRRYLIEPPATYLAAVPIQPGDAKYAPPPPSCSTPGWFGCPEQPQTYWKVMGMQPPGPNGAAGGGAWRERRCRRRRASRPNLRATAATAAEEVPARPWLVRLSGAAAGAMSHAGPGSTRRGGRPAQSASDDRRARSPRPSLRPAAGSAPAALHAQRLVRLSGAIEARRRAALAPKALPCPEIGLRRGLWPITTCRRDRGREAWPSLPQAIQALRPKERAARHRPALAAGLGCAARGRAGHPAGAAWRAV